MDFIKQTSYIKLVVIQNIRKYNIEQTYTYYYIMQKTFKIKHRANIYTLLYYADFYKFILVQNHHHLIYSDNQIYPTYLLQTSSESPSQSGENYQKHH